MGVTSGEYRPLGSDKAKIANVRIIAATSRNLQELVKEHKFNDALYERFDWITEIPPLRERRCDIASVLQSFLNSESMRFGFDASEWELGELAVELTRCGYDWPGNARSVIRLAKRAMVDADGDRSRFLTSYSAELLRAMRPGVEEQRVDLEVMLAQYIKQRVELLIRSPEEKNLNHQIQSLLSRGLVDAFDELIGSGRSLSNLKCAGIGEILGHSNLAQSGKGGNRNPLVGKFTSYTFMRIPTIAATYSD
jgi:DNA-binding NtrC family response regulator